MKIALDPKRYLAIAALLVLACLGSMTVGAQEKTPNSVLTNESVVKLVRAGFKEKTVITIIQSQPSRFNLTTEKLIDLKRDGVSEKIILAMLARDPGLQLGMDDLNDDSFFDSAPVRKPQQSDGSKPSQNGAPGIFGSNSGGQSRIRGSNGNGGGEGETETSGSVQVRIVRPPAETGGTPTLVRAATLTDDSILELVDAGFSEGTIIRRIEKSPAEFDLSAAKLSELRKRRVSEPIIEAMKAAMNEGPADPSDQKKIPPGIK
jgi:hypothetical protein